MKQNWKWKIPHTILERWTLCFNSYMNHELKVKPWWVEAHDRKVVLLVQRSFCLKDIFFNICVLSQCIVNVLNKLSEYIYFYISRNITLYTFVACFKTIKSLQCILTNLITCREISMKVRCSGLVPGQSIRFFRINNLFLNNCNIESPIFTNN